MTIGVLALQGAFGAHRAVLDSLDVASTEVRGPAGLDGIDGLIMPGGESTTMSLLLDRTGLREPLGKWLAHGFPVFGTCAGMIMLAHRIADGREDQKSFDLIDIDVIRNGYGRQIASFEADVALDGIAGGPFPAVFIRAPVVSRVGDGVTVLARHGDEAVLCEQGAVMVASFHPELSSDSRLHQRFVHSVEQSSR